MRPFRVPIARGTHLAGGGLGGGGPALGGRAGRRDNGNGSHARDGIERMRWMIFVASLPAFGLTACAPRGPAQASTLAASLSPLPPPPPQPASHPAASLPAREAGLQVGDRFVDLGLRRLDLNTGELAETVWLSSLVGEGAARPARLLLLHFFASWCEPCFAELPQLGRWQQQYRASGLEILGVNVRASGRSAADEMAATRQRLSEAPPFPLLFARFTHESTRAYLGSDEVALPAHLLLDGTGRVLHRSHGAGPAELASLEAAMLASLHPPTPGTPTSAAAKVAPEAAPQVKAQP